MSSTVDSNDKSTVQNKAAEGQALSRDEVKAQREAKRLEKLAKKGAAKEKVKDTSKSGPIAPQGGHGGDQVKVKPPPEVAKSKSAVQITTSSKEPSKKAPGAALDKPAIVKSPPKPIGKENYVNQQLSKVKELAISSRKSVQRRTSESKVHVLFDHLPKSTTELEKLEDTPEEGSMSPIFLNLYLKYASGLIHGSNGRARALIGALREYVKGYSPGGRVFNRGLLEDLRKEVDSLRRKKPFAVSMDNLVEYFLGLLREYEGESREELIEMLEVFERDRIDTAKKAIILKGKEKIVDGDRILVYGSSEVVIETLLAALREEPKKTFSIYAVERRASNSAQKKGQGLEFLKEIENELLSNSLNVTYVGINGLSNIMGHITKVFLGAHALLANGWVLASVGSSQISLLAHSYNIPVLYFCETYKFTDKSPTDSFSLNELDEDLVISERFSSQDPKYFTAPLIKYDLTPPEVVTAIITDIDILPCTSVPVVLRVQESRSIK